MDKNSADWNRLLEPQSEDDVMERGMEELAKSIAVYYNQLLAKGVPESLAVQLTTNFQVEMISGAISKWRAE